MKKLRIAVISWTLGCLLLSSNTWAANGTFWTSNSTPIMAGNTDYTYTKPGLWLQGMGPDEGGLPFRLEFGPPVYSSTTSTMLRAPHGGKIRIVVDDEVRWTVDQDGIGLGSLGTAGTGYSLFAPGRIHLRTGGVPTSGIWYSYFSNCNPVCTAFNTQFIGAKQNAEPTSDVFGVWNNNAWRFWFTAASAAVKAGGGYWAVAASEPVIQDVEPFKDGLETIKRIRPVKYQYNGLAGSPNDGRTHVGVVAQELEKVAPYMVQEYVTDRKGVSSDGVVGEIPEKDRIALKMVEGDAFLYLLINSVKELHAQNQAIEKLLCLEHPTDSECKK